MRSQRFRLGAKLRRHFKLRGELLERRNLLTLCANHFLATSTDIEDGREVSAGDLDGDGQMEFIQATGELGSLLVFDYSNLSGLPRIEEISSGGVSIDLLSIVDMDQDGDLDILAASTNDSTLLWFENSKHADFSMTPRVISTAVDRLRSIEATDVNNDGALDVVVLTHSGNRIEWFENQSPFFANSFTRHELAEIPSLRYVDATDLDGDGDVDFVSVATNRTTVHFHENLGGVEPTFQIRQLYENLSGPNLPRHLETGDLDGDDDIDIVITSQGSQKLFWLENTVGDTSEFVERPINGWLNGLEHSTLADLDADGDLDILAFTQGSVWFENENGDGTSFRLQSLTSPNEPRAVAVSDVNGDGASDLLFGGRDSLQINLNSTNSPGEFEPQLLSTYRGTFSSYGAGAGDMDGDGDLDFVDLHDDVGLRWFENLDGEGARFVEHRISGQTGTDMIVDDLDDDGVVDMLVVGSRGITRVGNHGRGENFSYYDLVDVQRLFSASVGYIDGNEFKDVVYLAQLNGSEIPQLLWQDATDVSLGGYLGELDANWAHPIDWDGDGDGDIVAGSLDGELTLIRNDGLEPQEFSQHALPADLSVIHDMQIGDVDGDGDGDIVVR